MSRTARRCLRLFVFALLGVAAGAIGVALRGQTHPSPALQPDAHLERDNDATTVRRSDQ